MRAPRSAPFVLAALLAAGGDVRPAAAGAGPWVENPQARVRLVTPWREAPAADEWIVGLHFTLAPGWHVYWKNSGDAGYPPAVDFAPTPAVAAAEILWPAPHRFDLPGGLVAFGYADEAVYPVRLRLDHAALSGTATARLAADLDYLVCEVDCVPYSVRLEVDQPLAGAGRPAVEDAAAAPLLAAWRARVPAAEGEVPGVATHGELVDRPRMQLVVTAEGAAARAAARPELFLEVHDRFQAGRPELERTDSGLVFRVPLAPRDRTAPPPAETGFAWTLAGLAADGKGAVEARRTLALGPPTAPAPAPPRGGVLDALRRRAGAPVAAALLALATLGLGLGLLGIGRAGTPATHGRRLRQALGFVALAAMAGPLYLLALRIDSATLALVELALLGVALAAWRFGVSARAPARTAWAGILLLLCVAAVKLAASP